MAELLKGAPVAAALNEKMIASVEKLAGQGITPTLAIFRVGERADDLSYERGAMKRCAQVGVAVRNVVLPALYREFPRARGAPGGRGLYGPFPGPEGDGNHCLSSCRPGRRGLGQGDAAGLRQRRLRVLRDAGGRRQGEGGVLFYHGVR